METVCGVRTAVSWQLLSLKLGPPTIVNYNFFLLSIYFLHCNCLSCKLILSFPLNKGKAKQNNMRFPRTHFSGLLLCETPQGFEVRPEKGYHPRGCTPLPCEEHCLWAGIYFTSGPLLFSVRSQPWERENVELTPQRLIRRCKHFVYTRALWNKSPAT